jgi:hypothetical protein
MLFCCNAHFVGSFSYVLFNTKYNYRRVEFGICPCCGAFKFRDYKQDFTGKEIIKDLTGKEAQTKLNQWRKKINSYKQGTKSKQNIYYGDFRKTNRKDKNGNPIYLQLRKNFNNEAEIIGEIKTVNYDYIYRG